MSVFSVLALCSDSFMEVSHYANMSSLFSKRLIILPFLSRFFTFSLFLLRPISVCVLPLSLRLSLSLAQQQHLHLLSPMATRWGYHRLQAD